MKKLKYCIYLSSFLILFTTKAHSQCFIQIHFGEGFDSTTFYINDKLIFQNQDLNVYRNAFNNLPRAMVLLLAATSDSTFYVANLIPKSQYQITSFLQVSKNWQKEGLTFKVTTRNHTTIKKVDLSHDPYIQIEFSSKSNTLYIDPTWEELLK